MKIVSFNARGVFGHLNFSIKFNDDLTFLIGPNGSGKTTAISLINAMLLPNVWDLMRIPFLFAELVFKDGHSEHRLICTHDEEEDSVIVNVSDVKERLIVSKREVEKFFVENDGGVIRNTLRQEEFLNSKYIKHPVFNKIKILTNPVYLGVDRRREEDVSEREMEMMSYRYRNHRDRLKKNDHSIWDQFEFNASGIFQTEYLVRDRYRKLQSAKESFDERLKNRILESVFEYVDVESFALGGPQAYKQLVGIRKKKEDILRYFSNSSIKTESILNKINKFFDNMEKDLKNIEAEGHLEDHFSLGWIINKTQIDRMVDVAKIIDLHNEQVRELFKSIDVYVGAINQFFSDSGKKVEVNSVGQIEVITPNNKKIPLSSLSSGERQIIVMFAQAAFNTSEPNGGVLFIDEPELSLHIGWQEKFSETIKGISHETQFVLATHSPEIISDYTEKCVFVEQGVSYA
tara:strand:- start:43057 stop:44436 length:1380 start_codon:yes stop_codon:yes gene_type:complete